MSTLRIGRKHPEKLLKEPERKIEESISIA
jgi:hypothetical protein